MTAERLPPPPVVPGPPGADPDDALSDRQRRAALLLVSGLRPAEVARRLAVRPETVSRWRRLEAFREEVERLHERQELGVQGELHALLPLAVEQLRALLLDGSEPSKRRVLELLFAATGLRAAGAELLPPPPFRPLDDNLPDDEEDEAEEEEAGGGGGR